MQDAILTDDYLAVGKIVKAHGIKGELKVVSYSESSDDLLVYTRFFLQNKVACKIFKVMRSRAQGKFTILQLSGVTTRNAADDLVGAEVFVLKSDMPTLSDDEYYWHELVGYNVVTDQGLGLGRVESLLATGAHDVLVISGKGKEYLLPVIRDVIVSIDREQSTLVVKPLPGLLEMNQPSK